LMRFAVGAEARKSTRSSEVTGSLLRFPVGAHGSKIDAVK